MYGTSVDWLGRLVEKLSGKNLEEYFREHIFTPLGMSDTFYNVPDSQAGAPRDGPPASGRPRRCAAHRAAQPAAASRRRRSTAAAGSSSTASDYIRFERMILNGGTLDGARILSADTVALMGRNQIGDVGVRALKTAQPDRSMDFTFVNDGKDKWGLGIPHHDRVRCRASGRRAA